MRKGITSMGNSSKKSSQKPDALAVAQVFIDELRTAREQLDRIESKLDKLLDSEPEVEKVSVDEEVLSNMLKAGV